jgi:hypothetical protein
MTLLHVSGTPVVLLPRAELRLGDGRRPGGDEPPMSLVWLRNRSYL